MNVLPKLGMQEVPFGMPEANLIKLLGPPAAEQTLGDVENHPKSRRVLEYVERTFLVTPELGVISITFENLPVSLWGTEISEMSPSELAKFLTSKQCDVSVGEPDGWGDQDVESRGYGIIASFCKGRLECIEIYNPTWRDNRH